MSNLSEIRKNLTTVSDLLKKDVFHKWKKSCSGDLRYFAGTSFSRGTPEQKGLLDNLCDKPHLVLNDITNSVDRWLTTYEKLLKKEIALTGANALDKFIRDGVNYIYRFAVIGNYFREIPSLFVDQSTSSVTTRKGLEQYKKNEQLKSEYLKIFNTQMERLLGCDTNESVTTKLLGLVDSVKTQAILEPVQDKIDYIRLTCNNIKISKLK